MALAWTTEDIEEVTQKDFKPCNTPLIKWKNLRDHVISHFLILPEVELKLTGRISGLLFWKDMMIAWVTFAYTVNPSNGAWILRKNNFRKNKEIK